MTDVFEADRGGCGNGAPCRRSRPSNRSLVRAALVLSGILLVPQSLFAQSENTRARDAVAVAEAALEAITREDMVALTDLMVDEAVMFPTRTRDGVAGYVARGRAAARVEVWDADYVERGFDAEVRVAGGVAMVWLPYDLYVDGAWSHCGADLFTMVDIAGEWKIAALAWSVEQPPDCRPHPDGPPE